MGFQKSQEEKNLSLNDIDNVSVVFVSCLSFLCHRIARHRPHTHTWPPCTDIRDYSMMYEPFLLKINRNSLPRRKANKRKNSEERGASSGVGMGTPREGALSGDVV